MVSSKAAMARITANAKLTKEKAKSYKPKIPANIKFKAVKSN